MSREIVLARLQAKQQRLYKKRFRNQWISKSYKPCVYIYIYICIYIYIYINIHICFTFISMLMIYLYIYIYIYVLKANAYFIYTRFGCQKRSFSPKHFLTLLVFCNSRKDRNSVLSVSKSYFFRTSQPRHNG